MTIRWAKDAARQLAAAHEYVAIDSPKAAGRLLIRIVNAVNSLGSYPHAGREGRVSNTRELVIVGTPYVVAYRIKSKNVIQILAILHGKRKWPKRF
ncbi:MAG: type II toxin-antitoxin system RelE/ParE family toxin [Candidatus Korobacteraceae bacterium]